MSFIKRCCNCDWSEDNNDCINQCYHLNLLLPSGEIGVFCSILHKVKKKDGGKYCKSFIPKVNHE